jgi:hypothetical protein
LGDDATAGPTQRLPSAATSLGHYEVLRQSRITLFNDYVSRPGAKAVRNRIHAGRDDNCADYRRPHTDAFERNAERMYVLEPIEERPFQQERMHSSESCRREVFGKLTAVIV